MRRNFSPAQKAYMLARAAFDVAYKACRKHDRIMDAECEKLGLETPYGILPEDHPLMIEAQRLLDRENEFRKLMYDAAHNLFDWATETALAKMGTPKQKTDIRQMVATVKKCAWVERFFIELVDTSMRLAAN
jgi:hypothetical protein